MERSKSEVDSKDIRLTAKAGPGIIVMMIELKMLE